jgi:hypothetical protein
MDQSAPKEHRVALFRVVNEPSLSEPRISFELAVKLKLGSNESQKGLRLAWLSTTVTSSAEGIHKILKSCCIGKINKC